MRRARIVRIEWDSTFDSHLSDAGIANALEDYYDEARCLEPNFTVSGEPSFEVKESGK